MTCHDGGVKLFTSAGAHISVSLAEQLLRILVIDLKPVTFDEFLIPRTFEPAQVLFDGFVVFQGGLF